MEFDFNFIVEQIPYLMIGAKNTLVISLIVLLLATIVGIFGALAKTSGGRLLRLITTIYVEVARNTPELVQIYFVFFVFPSLGLKFNSFVSGIIAMTFFGGGYLVEVFRAGIEAVPKTQVEAARSLALKERQIIVNIVFPQAMKICLPSLIGYLIFILKMSSLLATIGIVELTFVANDVIANNFHAFEMFTAVAVLYLIMVWTLSWLMGFVEKRFRYEV
ncbi:MAG: amino acid ABC transporter permease [Eubacteriales bacterium]